MDRVTSFSWGDSYVVGKSNYDYLAVYLDNTGTLVSGFGTNGIQTVGLGPADDVLNSAVIISGYAYAVGRSQNSNLYNGGDIESDPPHRRLSFPKTVTSFTVTPVSGSLFPGQTTTFTITATYSDSSTASIPAGSLDWSASGSAATVSSSGLCDSHRHCRRNQYGDGIPTRWSHGE